MAPIGVYSVDDDWSPGEYQQYATHVVGMLQDGETAASISHYLRWLSAHGTTCLSCGGRLMPVVYGYPTTETIEAVERGELGKGGCGVWDG